MPRISFASSLFLMIAAIATRALTFESSQLNASLGVIWSIALFLFAFIGGLHIQKPAQSAALGVVATATLIVLMWLPQPSITYDILVSQFSIPWAIGFFGGLGLLLWMMALGSLAVFLMMVRKMRVY